MIELQKQPQGYNQNFVYEIISDSSIPDIESLQSSSHSLNSTSAHHEQLKYWNPATNDNSSSSSHAQSVNQLIGELKQ